MNENRIHQLTKEIVSARLKQLEDPCVAAATLVRRTLEAALKDVTPGTVAESRLIEDASQGGMVALLLNEQNLSRGAVLILEAVAELASQLNVDQPEMMRSALRGIADMKRFVRDDTLTEIRSEIEGRFHGAGMAFEALCEQSGRAA